MSKDITNLQQVDMLLKAGIDPASCNLMSFRNRLLWMDDIEMRLPEHILAYIKDFPKSSFESQLEYMHKYHVIPLWTTCALLQTIPDSPKQNIHLTRGGYDKPNANNPDEVKYLPDAYFALYEYKDSSKDILINRIFGGDSYTEATVNLTVAYLNEISAAIG